jgi:hypothetical protein
MDTADVTRLGGPSLPKDRKLFRTVTDAVAGLAALLRRRRLYFGLGVFILGAQINFQSQIYLHDYVDSGKPLPVLSDMILDHLPYWDVSYLYDIFSLVSLGVFLTYIVHKRTFNEVPYYLLLCGIFHIIRGVFIVLTPLGHPALFDGTEGPFNGFSKFEMGVFPSGHTAISLMYILFARSKAYRAALSGCLIVIIAALFLSRGHYSVDVLSGLFFAYAIKAFGDKYLVNRFVIRPTPPLPQ